MNEMDNDEILADLINTDLSTLSHDANADANTEDDVSADLDGGTDRVESLLSLIAEQLEVISANTAVLQSKPFIKLFGRQQAMPRIISNIENAVVQKKDRQSRKEQILETEQNFPNTVIVPSPSAGGVYSTTAIGELPSAQIITSENNLDNEAVPEAETSNSSSREALHREVSQSNVRNQRLRDEHGRFIRNNSNRERENNSDDSRKEFGNRTGRVATTMMDVAGYATLGPLYAAFKAIPGLLNIQDDDISHFIGTRIAKILPQKNNNTANATSSEATTATVETRHPSPLAGDDTERIPTLIEEQGETEEEMLLLQRREAREDRRRHTQTIRAIRMAGRGSLFPFGSRFPRMGARARISGGRTFGRSFTRTARIASATPLATSALPATRAGARVASRAVAPVATATGATVATTGVAGATATRVASTGASRGIGATLRSAGGNIARVGGKAVGATVRALPVIGQIAAVGMAAMDAVEGWNDTELHAKAFNLKEGEEASTGQKASASVANVLDMGGLLTGAANLMGFDLDTADLASGIYNVGSTVADVGSSIVSGIGGFIGKMFKSDKDKEDEKEKKKSIASTDADSLASSALQKEKTAKTESQLDDILASIDNAPSKLVSLLKEEIFGANMLTGVNNFTIEGGINGGGGGGGSPIGFGGDLPQVTLKGDANQMMSAALANKTDNAIAHGVRYGFGTKNSKTGEIDCSGWVMENSRAMMKDVNKSAGREIFGKEAMSTLSYSNETIANGGAGGIIEAVSGKTGSLLTNEQMTPDKMKEGMLIGLDTGSHGWDKGRYKGIDHIVQTYRDPKTGQLMVSESSSGKRNGRSGVKTTSYDEWYKKWGKRARLYGTDLTRLANQDALEATNAEAKLKAETPTEKQPTVNNVNNNINSTNSTNTASIAEKGNLPPKIEKLSTIQPTPPSSSPSAIINQERRDQKLQGDDVRRLLDAQTSQSNKVNFDTSEIEKLLKSILDAIIKMPKPGGDKGSQGQPTIGVGFGDPALAKMASA